MLYLAVIGVVGLLIWFLRDSARRQGRADAINEHNRNLSSITRATREVDEAVQRLRDAELRSELRRARDD
jgi:hypothetical protein